MPSRDPVRWTSRIQGGVWSLDPDLPLAAVEPMTVIQSRAGVALGLVAAVAQATFLRSLLYDVSPQEPWTLSGAAVGLLAVAALASYLPARRAASIDPIIALRDS